MGDGYLLDTGPLNQQMIWAWAYDPEAELIEQDEDLALHDWAFTETLLELAADPECPKAEYILGIWNHFTRHTTIHQIPSDLEGARDAIVMAEKFSNSIGISTWIADQTRRLNYVIGEGATNEPKALAMAENLLNGADRSCPICLLRESDAAYLLQLSVPHGSHREWLLIDKLTGKFRYSRFWCEGEDEPRWFEPET